MTRHVCMTADFLKKQRLNIHCTYVYMCIYTHTYEMIGKTRQAERLAGTEVALQDMQRIYHTHARTPLLEPQLTHPSDVIPTFGLITSI